MITPACKAEAGAATVSLEVMGIIRVTATPIPKATMSTNKKSGLRFTFLYLSPFSSLVFLRRPARIHVQQGNY